MASPHPLLQGLVQKAAAPEERTAELKRGLAPIYTDFPISASPPAKGQTWLLTSAALRSSSSPGPWLSIKSICSRSPSPARPGPVSQQAGGASRPILTHHFLDKLPCSPAPSSLGCLGPRGSRASSEIRKDSSEKSSVDFKAERQRWDMGSLQGWVPNGFRMHSRDWDQVEGLPLGDSRGRSPSHDLLLRY